MDYLAFIAPWNLRNVGIRVFTNCYDYIVIITSGYFLRSTAQYQNFKSLVRRVKRHFKHYMSSVDGISEFVMQNESLDVLVELLHRNEGIFARDQREVHEGHSLSRNIRGQLLVGRVREVAKVFEKRMISWTVLLSEGRKVPLASYIFLCFIQVSLSQTIEMAKSQKSTWTASYDTHSSRLHFYQNNEYVSEEQLRNQKWSLDFADGSLLLLLFLPLYTVRMENEIRSGRRTHSSYTSFSALILRMSWDQVANPQNQLHLVPANCLFRSFDSRSHYSYHYPFSENQNQLICAPWIFAHSSHCVQNYPCYKFTHHSHYQVNFTGLWRRTRELLTLLHWQVTLYFLSDRIILKGPFRVYNFGVFLGSIISALADINEFSPSITLLFMGLPTMGFAATFAIYFFTIKNIETPARYLELGELHKAQQFLSQIYSKQLSLKILDNLQQEIDEGVYDRGYPKCWWPKRMKAFLFLIAFFFIAQFNGFFCFQMYGFSIASDGKFNLSSTNLLIFSYATQLVKFLSSLSAVPTVSQISHKILLISGSLIMAQCWLIFFFIWDQEDNIQMLSIITLVVLAYQFFQVWCFQALQFAISHQMETMYGNAVMVCFNVMLGGFRNIFLWNDPLFLTKYEPLIYFIFNLASFLFFFYCYHETRNKRNEELIECRKVRRPNKTHSIHESISSSSQY